MPTYLTPGVYVEEVPSQSKPIEGVGTSIAAFVGLAPGGPVDTPMRLSNWGQFARIFGNPEDPQAGPFMEGAYLAHAVYGFFHNGGSLCWVVRVGADSAAGAPQVGLPVAGEDGLEAFRAIALEGVEEVSIELAEEEDGDEKKPKTEAGDETGDAGDGRPPSFTLTVTAADDQREEHTGLSLKKGGGYIVTKVNAASKLIRLEETSAALPPAKRIPEAGSYDLVVADNGDARALTVDDVEGDVDRRAGMGGLAAVDEITMLCVPDLMSAYQQGVIDLESVQAVQLAMIAHCELMGDRMAILDTPPGLNAQQVKEWRVDKAGYDSAFAAMYAPWIKTADPGTGDISYMPPSGHVAGIWGRNDDARGVHKAPANEVVMGVNGLAFQVTQAEQGALNQNGINCIRAFPGRGIRIWGARTLSSDAAWRYLNVRRLFNYLEESILQGTQWAVFEPNDPALWARIRRTISAFLTNEWRKGALFGLTPEQAFFVKCDAETNPAEGIDAGQVVCLVGVAPVKPAEFVIFQLSQFSGGTSLVSE